jgi:hypothetical protein
VSPRDGTTSDPERDEDRAALERAPEDDERVRPYRVSGLVQRAGSAGRGEQRERRSRWSLLFGTLASSGGSEGNDRNGPALDAITLELLEALNLAHRAGREVSLATATA